MKSLILLISISTILLSCKKQKGKAFESKLVVECYLIPSQSLKLTLTETVPYFSSSDTPTVHNALVIISHDNISDTLKETDKGIYTNPKIVPPDYNREYTLYVKDTNGRVVTGHTIIQKPTVIDSVNFIFNTENQAKIIVYFPVISDSSYFDIFLNGQGNYDYNFFDNSQYNGISKPYESPFKFKNGENINVVLTRLNKDAFLYEQSYYNAYESNNTPILEPEPLKSNVIGGFGVFTGFYPAIQLVTVYK
jgi:hypothetical protein